MFVRIRHLPAFVWLLVLAVSGAAGTAGLYAGSLAQPADLQFGPRLFALLTPTDEIPSLLPPTVVLHAQLHVAMGGHFVSRYIASGGAEDQAIMEAAGLTVRVLDDETAGQVYYFADATAANVQTLAAEYGQVLYADPTVLLIATTPAVEQAMLETLLANRVSVAALTPDALNLQPEAVLATGSVEARRTAGADPTIASLLPLLSESELDSLIRGLDGETSVEVDNQVAVILSRYTLSNQILTAERFLYQYYVDLGMNPSYYQWTYGKYSGRNVVAELPGVEHPERIWIVGGHFDSISESPYNRAPGADDNGTGTAAVLLIAKLLHNVRFADTIRFVHFSGEEQGQWGSKRYAADLSASGAQVMGFLNLDMIGYDGNGDRKLELHTGLSAGANALGNAFIENSADYAQGLVIERKTTSATRFSDHSPFWDKGYPALLAVEDFFDNNAAGDRDRNPQYHRSGDQLDLVTLTYVARTARTALATVAELAGLQTGVPVETPTPTVTAIPTVSPTPLESGCADLLLNGDFEINGNWQFGSTPSSAAYDTTVQVSGQRALRMGLPPAIGNRRAHSSAFQKLSLPEDATSVTLHYWLWPGGTSDGIDYRETLLLKSNYSFLATLERRYTVTDTDQWHESSFDLLSYRGKTLVLYFNVYNNGGGGQQWNYIDGATLIACAPSLSVATPTPTGIPTATATVTPNGSETPEGTATATLAPTVPAGQDEQVYLPLISR